MSADAHVGHLRFDFEHTPTNADSKGQPWVFIQASRRNWTGEVHIDQSRREVYGYNTERQDYLSSDRTKHRQPKDTSYLAFQSRLLNLVWRMEAQL